MTDSLSLYGHIIHNRLLLGTAQYPSPAIMEKSIVQSKVEVVTVSLRREQAGSGTGTAFWRIVKDLNVKVMPNTAGCYAVREAVTTAQMAREVFGTSWIKLEVIGHSGTLQPHPFYLVEAAKILCDEGFQVFPYTTDDLIVCERLLKAGCKALMPWAAPIGTGKGLNNPYGLKLLRETFPDVPLIIDAGIGKPSHAAAAMETGYDAVLLNTAVAKAGDPVKMASAFTKAIEAGRLAYLAKVMEEQDLAKPSTPEFGTPFSPWSV